MEPRLVEIKSLDKAGIKKRYRELRKSGQNTHTRGGGIGMYEIAKISDEIDFSFSPTDGDKLIFCMKSVIYKKVKKDRSAKSE